MVLLPIEKDGQTVGYFFDCPGCKLGHAPYIHPYKNDVGASWIFNGDLEKPTFSPSILTKVKTSQGKTMICHCFVTNGKIRFLEDSTHSLAGRIVDLSPG